MRSLFTWSRRFPILPMYVQQYVEKKLGLVVGQNFKPNGDDF